MAPAGKQNQFRDLFIFLVNIVIYLFTPPHLLLLLQYRLHYGMLLSVDVSGVAARCRQTKRRRHIGLCISTASIASPFLIVIYSISAFLPSPSFSFFHPLHHHLSPHRHILTRRSRRTSSPFRPRSSTLDDCLSVSPSGGWRKKKLSLRLSINVLSLDFLFPSVYLSVWRVGSCLGALGLLSAKCWFLFFCQFTCLSERLRLDVST